MGILAAVLADARGVAFDVAGVQRRAVERWGEQEDQLLAAPNEILLDGGHRPRGPERLGGAREHPPRLRDRIDAAFRLDDRSEGGPGGEIGATIPISVPPMPVEGS